MILGNLYLTWDIFVNICCSSTLLQAVTQHQLYMGRERKSPLIFWRKAKTYAIQCLYLITEKHLKMKWPNLAKLFSLLCTERRNFKHWTSIVCMHTREQLQRCHLNPSFSYQHCHQQVTQLACTRLGCSTKYSIGMVTISLQSNGDGRVPKMG